MTRTRVLPVLLLTLLALGCAAPPEPSGASPSSGAVTAGPGSSPAATAATSSPAGSQSGWLPPRALAWVPIGEIPHGGGELLRWWFSGGYIALGGVWIGDDQAPVIWFSPDGRSWDRTDLMTAIIEPCPGWVSRPDIEVSGGRAAGGGALIVGQAYAAGVDPCGSMRPVVWTSNDGRTWTRQAAFEQHDELIGTYVQQVWAVPGGWEAAIAEAEERTGLWRSADGASWERVATMTDSPEIQRIVVANDGTRVATSDESGDARSFLVSTDGIDWQRVDGPPQAAGAADAWFISWVLPPDGAAPFWTVITAETGEPATAWVTTDFANWQSAPFPMPDVESIAHTSEGIVALASDPCLDTGPVCPEVPRQYFLSRDGLAWEPMRAAMGPYSFGEGPAGTVGIGLAPGNGEPASQGEPATVYRLEPYSDEEAFLFAGIREDAKFRCSPRRAELPAGAIAGVECRPTATVVDQVGFYLFADQVTLLESYFERVAAAGLRPDSGGCPRKPGEGSYAGGDPSASDPHRLACFVNTFDNANLRITYPESLVYVGVLGTGSSIKPLDDWAWKGGRDTGAPSLWQDPRP
jgi:hypothetical protein